MRLKLKWSRLSAMAVAAALIASACGSSAGKKTSATTAGGAETTTGGAATTAAGATAGGTGDAVDGTGAEALQTALKATESKPLKADSSKPPFVIGMPNLEGDPAGTFPDVREGAEAAVKMINERLGGIGADIPAGKAGRPIKLSYCGHKVDQNEAQSCANQIAGAKPQTVMTGVDFFTPLMYPLFKPFPVVETLPIFIADFNQTGVTSAFGGCPTAFPSSAQLIGSVKKHDKLAVIWAQNAPGTECWKDTQERFYQYEATTQGGKFGFKGFPYNPGETAGYPAVVQNVVNYLQGASDPAVYFGIQASDCAAFVEALRGAGAKAQIYIADSCNSDAVRGLAEAKGIEIELQGYVLGQPDLYSPLVAYELAQREAAIKAYGPKVPLSSYTRQAFTGVVWVYQVASGVVAGGGNIDDAETMRKAYAAVDHYHLLGYRPISCVKNPPEYQSVCARTATYATWDGRAYKVDPKIPGGVIDVTDLMLAVAKASPRKAG